MKPVIIKCAALFGLAIACYALVTPVPTAKKHVLGTWIGFTPVPNDFYRIVLDDSGGLVGYHFPGHNPILYKIESWEIGAKAQLKTTIRPVSTNCDTITITGEVKPWKLDLIIKSPDQGWRHNVTLHREQLIEDRIKVLRSSMEAFTGEH